MNAARWTFRLPDGSLVTGPVHGSGGVLRARDGRGILEIAADRPRAGEPLPMFEPAPGHVRVYPGYCADGNGEPVDVDLRTAVLL